jgi:hypothetical protein
MFTRRKVFSGIKQRFVILALMPLLSLLGMFTPFFNNTAAALGSEDVLNRARAWSILNTVINQGFDIGIGSSNVDVSDADKCAIFGPDDNDGIFVGSHVTGDDEDNATWEDMEDNTGTVNAALASVGISGGCRGMLEKIGYTYDGGTMIAPRSFSYNDAFIRDKLRAAVKADAFFGAKLGDAGPGDAIAYSILYYHLTKVCGWGYRNAYVDNDKADSDEGRRNREAQGNGWTGDETGHYRTYTFEVGKAGWNTYHRDGGTTGAVYVGPNSGFGASTGGNGAEMDCSGDTSDTIPAKLADNGKYARAYADVVKPGGKYTPGTCGEKYPATGTPAEVDHANALRTACDEGYRNKGDTAFCDTKYPSGTAAPGLNAACKYGQNTATGGANDTTPPEEADSDKAEDKVTCVVPGIGWIICPILNTTSAITDGIYAFVAAFLTVQPVTNDPESGLFIAWSVMRNFANVAFVIVFLIIIISQVTSMGISNYGIKRMLPRLIVAAILVNISFWVCAIAVDLSNIGGSSIKALFDNIGEGLALPVDAGTGGWSVGNQWQGVTTSILGGVLLGAALYVALSALIPVLMACLITIVIVFLALIIRQALIVLLIVVSPIAFVAYLLPNTETLFTRWRRMFTTLLMMYPIIALAFGAAALAGQILAGS